MTCNLEDKKKRHHGSTKVQRRRTVDWDKLKIPEVAAKFREKIENPEDSVEDWNDAMKLFEKAGNLACGSKAKRNLSPWLDNHLEEIGNFQNLITRLTQEMNNNIPTATEERKTVRKDYKKAKKRWEEEWWMEIVEDARKAELQGDIGTLYKTLKRIGIRDNCTFEDETFSPEEFRSHFMKVSENRYERGRDEIVRTMEEIPERFDQTALEAAIELERVVTWSEFETKLAKIRDGAPGNDGVRMLAVKVASKPIKQELHRMIGQLIDMKPEEWPEEIKEGWVIPLHKKGPKNDLGNYRGVCLLPLASRLIARILATRLRTWAETIGALDENQNGFRGGRSTADSTQIIIRMEEETKRVYGMTDECNENRPGAVLLDITKAYPRTNKPLLWGMLARFDMTDKVLDLLKGLHEETRYRVKGKEGLSDDWAPARGLREGCATSPILFNVYHAEAIRRAERERRKEAAERGQECGLTWRWTPGGSLPPREGPRALHSSNKCNFILEDSLFADDTSLLGWTEELVIGKEVIKKKMMEFEEKCHDGKEESITFATTSAQKTRMLGTLIGKREDRGARIKRGYHAWSKVKQWLWNSSLSKRTRALVVQAVVESTLLFDCSVRAWTPTDIQKFQSVADRAYRFVWNNGKPHTLIRMQNEGVNSYEIRRQLNIESIRTKIECRALERMGHVLRMSDERIVKKAVLGSWDMERTRSGNSRGNTIQYWRRLLKEAGHEDDNSENLTNDRKRWKKTVTDRRTFLKNWETQMCNWHRGTEKPARSQWNRERISDSGWPCRWDGCDKMCATKGGRTNHERKAHRRESVDFKCPKCNDSFSDQAALTNHFKACQGGQGGFCPKCQRSLSLSNMARHRRTCRGEHPTAPEVTNTIITGRFAGTRARIQCEECGTWVTKNNISRHWSTCPGNWESRPPTGRK